MKKLLLIFCLWAGAAQADDIALSFDDLPGPKALAAVEQRAISDAILKTLKAHHAPAIGFVNEGIIALSEKEEKTMILEDWVKAGHALGNHTYSHLYLSDTALADYERDVIHGAMVTRHVMRHSKYPYRYFRRPYLDTGDSETRRLGFEAFLKREGYVTAPVTIDANDWKFNEYMLRAPDKREAIIQAYLDHSREQFLFMQMASEKIFGRNIRHVLLLHANEINAVALPQLLTMIEGLGYHFTTIDHALLDEAYHLPDAYYPASGASWLYRWDRVKDKVVDWKSTPVADLDGETHHERQ